jgi:hypothetical protein
MADNKIVTLLNTWQCNEQESFLDLSITTLSIEKSKDITNDYKFHGIKYITSQEGFKKLDNKFIKEIKNNFKICKTENLNNILNALVTSETDIEKVVEKYQYSMTTARKKSFKVWKLSKTTIGNKSVPWWTRELTIQTKKLNTIRWRYQRTIHDNNLR